MEKSWLSMTVLATLALCVCVSGMGMDKGSQSFGSGAHNDERYQKWYEWLVKRGLGGSEAAFGNHPQEMGRFLDWGSMYNSQRGKRQLSGFPDRFGNFQRFFTNGLQDWKSTFNGEKRATSEK